MLIDGFLNVLYLKEILSQWAFLIISKGKINFVVLGILGCIPNSLKCTALPVLNTLFTSAFSQVSSERARASFPWIGEKYFP